MANPTSRTNKTRRITRGRASIENAALQAFYDRGYNGTSIRDIAAGAGTTAASLYHYFENKQDILFVLMRQTMHAALQTTREALVSAGTSPADQLDHLVRAWVKFHAERRVEARIGLSELNSLEHEGRLYIVGMRDEQEMMFRAVVNRGVALQEFSTAHPREAARAILNMGTVVATWFRPGGEMSADEIADIYADLARATVGARSDPQD
ncbi:TetR/AcrR family transcriptional regulator [Microbacterium sp. AGC85]